MTTTGIIKKAKHTAKRLGDAMRAPTTTMDTASLLYEARKAINTLVGVLEAEQQLAAAMGVVERDHHGH